MIEMLILEKYHKQNHAIRTRFTGHSTSRYAIAETWSYRIDFEYYNSQNVDLRNEEILALP